MGSFQITHFYCIWWDTRFVGKFWSSLWELMDTKLKKSTTFHPQIDGQTEVVNMMVIQLLRGYCSKHPKLWNEHLCYVQCYASIPIGVIFYDWLDELCNMFIPFLVAKVFHIIKNSKNVKNVKRVYPKIKMKG